MNLNNVNILHPNEFYLRKNDSFLADSICDLRR